jgi:hypothetical protein
MGGNGSGSGSGGGGGARERGRVEHDWVGEGWGPFEAVVMSADGAQAFTQWVADGAGVLTATEPGAGNLRVAYLRDGTDWTDSEMTSLIVGPEGWNGINNAQQGHLHRVREVEPGLWEGIAVWTAVVGGTYELLNVRGVRFDGATLFQSGGESATRADAGDIDRTVRVLGRERFQFISTWINQFQCLPADLHGLGPGDIVSIADVSGDGFNEAAIAVGQADRAAGMVQIVEPTDTTTEAFVYTPAGLIRPAGVDGMKRWCPFWLSTRVRGGTDMALTVEIKRWRDRDPEPDWSDRRVIRHPIAAAGNVPALAPGPGLCGLWGAHFSSGSSASWGALHFRNLSA